jgi:DNA-binding LytR/AlgR family response regulator
MIDYDNNMKKRTRITVRKGVEHITLRLHQVALFYTENKIVFAIDDNEKKYICDKTLSELEEELDGQQFFRANRQCIVNIDFIKSFRPYERVKLEVKLLLEAAMPFIVISQETAQDFRKWIYEL